ncbi:hypothetical protein M378DRAFT_81443 [Amanita muscaria Koide BX008]|uniref:Oxysterol-binding protein n=1 Tax=Amanita muscaria (strain Koide BX008) TaxID=946122 RepID=A0A0C2WL27_AMAMK|nr:hypothetical protein M378DRAFT_81443 [Amanita muscaria Koide BX008]
MSSNQEEQQDPISLPESDDVGEGGKLAMIVSLVKKCLGVKDIAAMRLSLPASLLEPIPNLEYWHYLDRPDIFASVNDSHDPFQRMLAVLRFTLTKDLKFIHGKVCKPYNSVLGEHFRAHWDVVPPRNQSPYLDDTSRNETASIRSVHSNRSGFSFLSRTGLSSALSTPTNEVAAHLSTLSLNRSGDAASEEDTNKDATRTRIIYVTEQVSHHPPVSAYFAVCPSRHVQILGLDQITAKVSGTTLRVAPGQYNRGIYLNMTGGHGEGEAYHINHPIAHVNGILRGSFYITVGESTIITCTGYKGRKGFRTIIEYKEESWLGRPHFLLEGVIHTVFDGDSSHEEWTKVKHVPTPRVVAVFDGSWRGKIRWSRVGTGSYPDMLSSTASSPSGSHVHLPHSNSSTTLPTTFTAAEYATLIDLSVLKSIPKTVRPLERQLPYESRKLWDSVTRNLLEKNYSDATREKVQIEQRQRDLAAERKRKGIEFVPKYFDSSWESGVPTLTEEGWKAVGEELEEDGPFSLEAFELPTCILPN